MIYYSLIEKQEVKQEWLTTSPTQPILSNFLNSKTPTTK
jgi:hypothetical protein